LYYPKKRLLDEYLRKKRRTKGSGNGRISRNKNGKKQGELSSLHICIWGKEFNRRSFQKSLPPEGEPIKVEKVPMETGDKELGENKICQKHSEK